MQLETFAQVSAQIERELDIQDEDLVGPEEMMGYCNSAIADAEAIIHNLYEGYFRRSDRPTLTIGQTEVPFPSDCYAFKIVKVYWVDTNRKYEIERMSLEEVIEYGDADDYGYDIESATSGAGATMVVYPPIREATSTKMRRFYIRTANRVTDDSSVIDIPQFSEFVKMHMRVNCAIKAGHPLLSFWTGEREKLEQRMRDTLKAMVLDGANNIEADPSFYQEMI